MDGERLLPTIWRASCRSIDSLCFAVDDIEHTRAALEKHGITFSRFTEFHDNKVAFVHPRDACGLRVGRSRCDH